jgi:hypothetical protein
LNESIVLETATDPAHKKRLKEFIGVHRSPSSKMSRDKLKSEAGRGCKSSADSIGVHRNLSFR